MERINLYAVKLDYRDLGVGENTYDYSGKEYHDIVNAEYINSGHIPEIPDIAALPNPTVGQKLLLLNTRDIDYDVKKISNMGPSERLRALKNLKNVIEPIYFHERIELNIHDALEQSYQRRALAYASERKRSFWNCSNNTILCLNNPLFTNTPGFTVLGIPGCGKSTAVSLTLSRYPRAIQHTFSNYAYVQIPIIAVVAYPGSNIGDLLTSMAIEIDRIMGYDGVYTERIKKQHTVGAKATYLCELIDLFHVGLIIIDELEMLAKTESINELLTITAKTGVAFGLIGTEESIQCFDKNPKLGRRVCGNCIAADDYSKNVHVMNNIIEKIWKYQWTKRKQNLTDDLKRALIEESYGNLDLLTNIIICAQRYAIINENIAIDENLIRRIGANDVKLQKSWVMAGSLARREGFEDFRTNILAHIEKDAKKMDEREFNNNYQDMISSSKQGKYVRETELRKTINAMRECGFSYDDSVIKTVFFELEKSSDQFKTICSTERTKQVRMALEKKQKGRREKPDINSQKEMDIEEMRESLEEVMMK